MRLCYLYYPAGCPLAGHWAVPIVAEGSVDCLQATVPGAVLRQAQQPLLHNTFLQILSKVRPHLRSSAFSGNLSNIVLDHELD